MPEILLREGKETSLTVAMQWAVLPLPCECLGAAAPGTWILVGDFRMINHCREPVSWHGQPGVVTALADGWAGGAEWLRSLSLARVGTTPASRRTGETEHPPGSPVLRTAEHQADSSTVLWLRGRGVICGTQEGHAGSGSHVPSHDLPTATLVHLEHAGWSFKSSCVL